MKNKITLKEYLQLKLELKIKLEFQHFYVGDKTYYKRIKALKRVLKKNKELEEKLLYESKSIL